MMHHVIENLFSTQYVQQQTPLLEAPLVIDAIWLYC